MSYHTQDLNNFFRKLNISDSSLEMKSLILSLANTNPTGIEPALDSFAGQFSAGKLPAMHRLIGANDVTGFLDMYKELLLSNGADSEAVSRAMEVIKNNSQTLYNASKK